MGVVCQLSSESIIPDPGNPSHTKILRLWNGEIITGELGQNDLLKIIDYSTDNGRIGFRMMNFFHFVNHKNSFRLHRNHVIKRFSLRWVPRRGQSELPWSKYPRSNISGHVNLISNDQNFDQKCDPKFRLYHQKLKYFSSSKSWLFIPILCRKDVF